MMESLYIGGKKRWIEDDWNGELPLKFDDYPAFFRRLLLQRGIGSRDELERFLMPDARHLHDPFLMKGMDRAVKRVIEAIERRESVLIYGDYDMDGVAAVSILIEFLRKAGLKPEFYIPDRAEEGYGISDAAVDVICGSSFDLMI